MPWWVQVLAVHAATRLIGLLAFALVAPTQAATPWASAQPSLAEYTGLFWDGTWYRTIAERGYPAELPRGPDGRVVQNAWAFFPLFPGLVRVLMVTGLPWHVAAPLLATALGAAAMLMVYRVVAAAVADGSGAGQGAGTTRGRRLPDHVRRRLPLVTVALVGLAPAAPVLGVAYTESLALLLLSSVLWCLVRHRYGLAVPLVLGLGLTRAVALPVVVAVVLHAAARWRAGGLRGPVEQASVAGLAVLTVASGLLWPAVAGWVTGEPDAYTRTQAAWRGRGEVVPLVPWLDVSRWLLGGLGPVVLVVLVLLLALLVVSRPMRRLGPVLQGWTAGYLGYLLVVAEPGTSLVRFGLLAFPVAGVLGQVVLARRRPAWWLAGIAVLGVLGQVAWVATVWRLVPPSGWPP